jgi:serine/threonine protein kinase/outer membrane protein assembly factor BamD (BamD/ComL family)
MASDTAQPFSALGPGTLLDGKYEILSLIGAGGMGEVFKARHVHLNAFRCIKVMKQGLLADDVYRARFLREAQLATQIHHPNIAVVHDFFLAERGSYMVTEFIDGTTVRQWSRANGRFPLALAADVAVQVLSGLDHIHRRGLLHRDISSDNVMLSYDTDNRLAAKIIDLGIAKDINTASPDTTQAGMLIGNPKYMSPEQLGDLATGEQIDNRADLYCLGVVLFEMILGVPPFVSETPHGYIVKHLTQPPPRFESVQPDVEWPEGLEPVIMRALEKDRRRRYSDAREFSIALQRFLTEPAGTLSRDAVSQLRRGPSKTIATSRPGDLATEVTPRDDTKRAWKKTVERDTIEAYREYLDQHPDAADSTAAKARLFELSLLQSVREKEEKGDRDALKRLAEGHPPGSLVGDAVREAIARVTSAHREEDEFQRAWEMGTPAAWRAFIDAHRGSSRVAEAQKLLDEATSFEAASNTETDTGLREFLKVFPDGRHHLDAEIKLVSVKQRIAAAAFEQAKNADTYIAMRDFLARFPTSAHAEEARNALEERLAFETAAATDSEDAWDDYLAKWASDRHADDARSHRDAIRAREEEAYNAAANEKTAAAWEAFLAKYPDGRRNARAERNRREALAFEKARDGGRKAIDEFVRAYPDGLLSKEARRIARQLGDDDDFAHAKSHDTAAAYSLYLTTHPAGKHAENARGRLGAIEDEAFSAIVASKNVVGGREFLNEFPQSPRRDQVSRLVAMWSEAAAVQEALDAIAAGDVDTAESKLRKINDAERKSEVVAAITAFRDRQDRETRKKRRQTEPSDWNAAWEAGSVAAWDRYLAEHDDADRASDARRHRQESVDFDLAVATNTKSMWRAFLKAWPEGRHRLDAEIRLRGAV